MADIKFDEESAPSQDALLKISENRHIYLSKFSNLEQKQEAQEEILKVLKEQNMIYAYEDLIGQKVFNRDEKLIGELKEKADKDLKELERVLKDAEDNLGESDVKKAKKDLAMHFKNVGKVSEAYTRLSACIDEAVGVGPKLDYIFQKMIIDFYKLDMTSLKTNVEVCKQLVEEGGDWERKNRLKVFEGVYCMLKRDFQSAASLFLDCIATFEATELFSYETFIYYAVLMTMFSLPRSELKQKVVNNSTVLSVINKLPMIHEFLLSLYNCQYHKYLLRLCDIVDDLRFKVYLSRHANFFCREMRILAYNQYLTSYKSVTFASSSQTFGLGIKFMDEELSRYIAAGRLNCKLDRVNQVIETTQSDENVKLYQGTLKMGDPIMNRLEKLGRVRFY